MSVVVKRVFYLTSLIVLSILNLVYFRQHYIEPVLKYSLGKQQVVIALSTTPHRIAEIKSTLDSLTNQKLQAPIYLSVPYTFKRDNIDYVIPDWLHSYPGVTILRTKDYGPATKLLGLLEQVDLEPNTIIITVDDDVIYPKNLVLHLVYKAKQNPNAAIGIIGADFDYDAPWQIATDSLWGLTNISTPNARVSVLKGYGGVAYRKKFFNANIFNLAKDAEPCYNTDDILISYSLAQQHIPRTVLINDFISPINIRWQTELGNSGDALHLQSTRLVDKHKNCLAYLHNLDPDLEF